MKYIKKLLMIIWKIREKGDETISWKKELLITLNIIYDLKLSSPNYFNDIINLSQTFIHNSDSKRENY